MWLTASAHVGNYCKIADDVINHGMVGDSVTIERSTEIGINGKIGSSSKIGENCTINGHLNSGVEMGKSSTV